MGRGVGSSGRSPYGRMMAARPADSVVVGTPATTVLAFNLLLAVPGVVLLLGELIKEEQVSVYAVFNY